MGMAGPAVIADAYDLYADQLYAYCRFFARDPADAVDALESIFLVAAGRGAALPLDGQLRTWLFAVARNECLRGARSRRTVPGPGRRPGGSAEGRTGRELLINASGGLAPGDRDLLAMLWHGLDADDMAAVLGIDREESFARLNQALGHLDLTAGALLVARSGRQDCADLARLLGSWDGRLDEPLARKITQHADRCDRCRSRRQDEPRPELLLSLTPAALLGAGVSAEALRSAAASVTEVRDQVLGLACDRSDDGGAARRHACGLAGPFGLSLPRTTAGPASRAGGGDRSGWTGFPVPLPADPVRGVPRNRLAMALTGTAVVALAATAGFAVAGPGLDPQPGLAGRGEHSATAVSVQGATLPSLVPATAQSSPRPAPTISVPPGVTLERNGGQGQLRGTLPVTVKGGPVTWSVSNPNPGLRLSPAVGASSASVTITGRVWGSLQPLTVIAGNATFTVTLTDGS